MRLTRGENLPPRRRVAAAPYAAPPEPRSGRSPEGMEEEVPQSLLGKTQR